MKAKSFKGLWGVLSIFLLVVTAWGAGLEVHVLDVGQGDSTLIVSPTGKTVLVDSGTGTAADNVVTPYLENLGITDLDYIVVSHYDRDHYAGVDNVIDELDGISHIRYAVYDRGGVKEGEGPMFIAYRDAVEQKRTAIVPGDVIDLGGGAVLKCIAAGGVTTNETVNLGSKPEENELSVVVILSYCDFQMFLGGDVGKKMEPYLAPLAGDMDVYKVSHHGSKNSSTQGFLDAITPEVSVISVGSTNAYGHPADEVIHRLIGVGSYMYQTGDVPGVSLDGYGETANGSFLVETDGFSYTVSGSDISTATWSTDGSHSNCSVIFSEILYDSTVYGDTAGEWIELYNPTSAPVDLGGWTIEDNYDEPYSIPAGTTIGPNCFLLIADDRSEFYGEYGCYPHLSGLSLRLNNDGDYLTLEDDTGLVMDRVAWESGGSSVDGWGSSSKPEANEGKSIRRADLNVDTDTYADWSSSQTPDPGCGGTPRIQLSRTQFMFTLCKGASDSETFLISNSGCGTLNWSVSDNAGWLGCSPTSGTGSGEVTVTVTAGKLEEGTYTGTITVSDSNAADSPRTVSVTLTVQECGEPPEIALSRTQLYFGAAGGTGACYPQTFFITNAGDGTLEWTITGDAGWLDAAPTSGTGDGMVTVSVDNAGLAAGTYTGTFSVSAVNASNSPQRVSVTLNVYASDAPPFGMFATPADGTAVSGSVPVTGWVLDDVGVESVKIYRKQGSSRVYIGDALMVEGARPDIEQAYPQYPMNYNAGWGYMLLTHFLPDGGNGTYELSALASDCAGQTIILGTKTITCDNANAVKPFGAIDTPGQGGDASGTAYRNNGWVLTPIPNKVPEDGSTIDVYVDGVLLGHPVYNIYRSDIAAYFPGCANSNGAHARFDFDTTAYENGVHTIFWIAANNAGNADGIGSRYFNIRNTTGTREQRAGSREQGAWKNGDRGRFMDIPVDYDGPVTLVKGYGRNTAPRQLYPDETGTVNLEIMELERVELHLTPDTPHFPPKKGYRVVGYRVVGDRLRGLPVGSTFDRERDVFYWQPGPGFVGEYEFVFIEDHAYRVTRKKVRITIRPKSFD